MSSLLKYNGNPFEPREVVEGFETNINGDTDVSGDATTYVPAAGD
jgi:pyruvate ferredoxin oxidoreductase alpha subunit